jgi:predicted acetyltransferase
MPAAELAGSPGMPDVEIVNPIAVDEVSNWLVAVSTTLLGSPYEEDFARRITNYRREWLPDRAWGAREHGRWVATLATDPKVLTVPGAAGDTLTLPADGLTAVSVAATHRRRGLLSRMIGQSLQAAKERGEPLSVLIAAEWSIYGRFGYAPAADETNYRYHPRRAGASLAPSGTGIVRQVDPAEFGGFAADLYDRARRTRAGQVDRGGDWWPRRLGLDGYETDPSRRPHWIVREGDAGPDGVLAWKVTRDFDVDGTMGVVEVPDLFATNADAYRDLWAYLSGIDLIGEIALNARPIDEPARWLIGDGRALHPTHTGDGLWLRLLDVPVALAGRRYAVEDRLVLDVIDPAPGGYGQGRVRLDGGPDGAECEPSTASADLRLSQLALAGAYLGGHSLHELRVQGGVEELTPGAIGRADAMLRTGLAPWNATMF